MTDDTHKAETLSQTSTIKWQLTSDAFAKATGNKCTRFGKNRAHNDVT